MLPLLPPLRHSPPSIRHTPAAVCHIIHAIAFAAVYFRCRRHFAILHAAELLSMLTLMYCRRRDAGAAYAAAIRCRRRCAMPPRCQPAGAAIAADAAYLRLRVLAIDAAAYADTPLPPAYARHAAMPLPPCHYFERHAAADACFHA
jgi:hypothetical protein